MTKEEVLQGALALNGDGKGYVVTVEGDRIVIQTEYSAIRDGSFCCVAHLNDDNTYVETHTDNSGRGSLGGKSVRVKRSISFTFGDGGVEVEKKAFNSQELKKVLRDYLASCGYKRTKKGFFKALFGRKRS